MAKDEQAEITINYETIYDLLRREKQRDDIQKLEPGFYPDLVDYIRNKTALLTKSKDKHDLFSAADNAEVRTQIENIQSMIKDLYERREKKIIMMALNQSRTGSSLIDTSSLLTPEKEFFEEIIVTMDRFRKGILERLSLGEMPDIESRCAPSPSPAQEALSVTKTTKLVRFLKPVPKFVDEELEVYGPFQEDDMASLPLEIADVLINKERAEEMQG